MKIKSLLFAALAASMLVACETTPEGPESTYDGLTEVTYTSTSKVFVNPERGMYTQKSFHSLEDGVLSANASKAARSANRSLFLVLFYLTDYIDCDIEQAYLDNMQTTFDNIRTGGTKS